MRTTVAIDDEVLAAAKQRAQRQGLTLGAMIENALRHELARRPTTDAPPVPVYDGRGGPRPGIDIDSNRALAEALDDGLALTELR